MNKFIFNTVVQRKAKQAMMLKSILSVIVLGGGFIYIVILILEKW